MESPLSFNSSENFRKKLLVRNLPPYKVDNAFSNESKPGSSEFTFNDLSTVDSPSVEQIGDKQEKLLLPINQYGPQTPNKDYGSVVTINDNQNYKTNEGEYGYPDTIGSDLETIGNNTEKQIIIKNVYRPENGLSDFGSTAWYINNDKVITTIGEGEYTVQDTVGSGLETTANTDRPTLITNNQYGPQTLSNVEVSINNNFQTNANEGEYGFPDTVDSPLEIKGESDRPALIAINQYGPQNLPTTEVLINNNLQTNSNEGEYGYPDTVDSELQIVGEDIRKPNFLQNPWGPEQGQSEVEVEPYRKQKNLVIPQGNYLDETDTYGNELEFKAGVKETEAYLSNRYATGEGFYDPTDFKNFQLEALQLPYANSDNTFIFLPSTYTPYSILLEDNPSGSDGTLSEDSDLAMIGAKSLNKEFKHRVALELYQQTLGQVNIFNSNVDPLTGEISAKPNTDPFDAIGLLTGNIPIVSRVYNITTPDFLFGQGINFAAKLAGLYSPYSYIPGEYFDYPDRIINGPYVNPLSIIGGAIGSLFSVLQGANQSSSELMLEYTSVPTRKLLYDQLKYNQYRPNYKIGNNLTAPQGVFYIGERKNHLTELLSPAGELPQNKDRTGSSIGPVQSYSKMGKLYETDQLDDTLFGINSRNFYSAGSTKDGCNLIGSSVFGGFTWVGSKNPEEINNPKPGALQGRGGEQFEDTSEFKFGQLTDFGKSESTRYNFTPGSILDVTQKLIDAGQRKSVQNPKEHVGNAINQITKVFNDGYQEITKGSKTLRWTTKNSTGGGQVQGLEYCRVFTKDRPYYTFDELQKTDGNIRKFTSSVLDSTYNLNIAPVEGSSLRDGRVKKYMFSLENLAWGSSNKKGYTYDDLPACEKGPNGGRIMWFPPYELSFDESISTSWQDNNFLGRTEPIYTYTNTSRKGNVSFKIIVDHPSILNLLVDEELKDISDGNEITQIIDSFFAGCTKYDLWDLVSKFPNFTPSDIFQAQILTQEDLVTVVEQNSYTTIQQNIDIGGQVETTPKASDCVVFHYEIGLNTNLEYTACSGNQQILTLSAGDKGDICVKRGTTPNIVTPDPSNIVTPTGQDCELNPSSGQTQTTPNETPKPTNISFPDIGFYFDNDYPIGKNTRVDTVGENEDFEFWYKKYINSESCYLNGGCENQDYQKALDKIIQYGDAQKTDVTNYVLGLDKAAQDKYLDSFIDTRKSEISEFFKFIKSEFDEAKKFIETIGPLMADGNTVKFSLGSSASSVSDNGYNLHLSKRRLDSVIKWLKKQSYDGTKFDKFIQQGKLVITSATPSGETATIDELYYKQINCSKPFKTSDAEGTVSVNAMACRRTKIFNVDVVKNNSENENGDQQPSNTQVNQETAGQDFTINGQSNITPTTTTSQQPNTSTNPFVNQQPDSDPNTVTPPNTREQVVNRQERQTYKDLTKRLARKLLTECNYFEYLERTNPMIYDGIKSKIKYFQPAFHSITPEGLNSRLVFLQQCMRPGDTIPTVSTTGQGQEQLIYNDVSNSAFGAPPICVLRIGDFFNTKIAIDQISLKYDDGKFDLNPEGIGIQPMIATVSISFSFIGAHGLAGPVAKLQNALSFNYYANTEMYDERAESTETLDQLETYDRQILDQVEEQVGVVDTSAPRPEINNGGVTIGKTLTNVLNIDTSVTTGTIEYKDIFSNLVDGTKNYADKVTTTLEKINEEFLFGGLQIFTKDRKYTEGNFNYLGGNMTDTATIFGYSDKIQTKMDNLATEAKTDVDDGTTPLLVGIGDENLSEVEIRKVKRQIKKDIDSKKDKMLNSLQNYSNEITNTELNYINLIDKINYVSNGNDGFIKKNNSTIIYNLSGTTEVTQPTLTGVNNTLQELIEDSLLIKNDLNDVNLKLIEFSLIPTGNYDYSENYTQDMYFSSPQPPNKVVYFMLFGKEIIDDPNKFAENLILNAIPDISDESKTNWMTWLMTTLTGANGLVDIYKSSKTTVDKKISDYKTTFYNPLFNTYKTSLKGKERKMWYESQLTPTEITIQNLKIIYSNKSSKWDKFNLQKSFK
jgi:hypothetical protein